MPAFFVPRRGRPRFGGRWVAMPLSQALIPPQVSARHAGGSFLVVRKLEQNVAGFRKQELELAARGLPVEHLVGRDRAGCPLATLAPRRPAWEPQNAFDFNPDPAGARCPFHSHIRKVNPREDPRPADPHSIGIAADDIVRAQPVRRGMVYDPRRQLVRGERSGDWPETGTGLMFMAFMSHIGRQFEQLQFNWFHDPDFPRAGAGTDSLLAPTAHGIQSFITPRGGEYLYAPARSWVRAQAG